MKDSVIFYWSKMLSRSKNKKFYQKNNNKQSHRVSGGTNFQNFYARRQPWWCLHRFNFCTYLLKKALDVLLLIKVKSNCVSWIYLVYLYCDYVLTGKYSFFLIKWIFAGKYAIMLGAFKVIPIKSLLSMGPLSYCLPLCPSVWNFFWEGVISIFYAIFYAIEIFKN